MKKNILLTLLLIPLILSGCNWGNNEDNAAHKAYTSVADSDKVQLLDNTTHEQFTLPPLYNNLVYDSTTINQFYSLANATGGQLSLAANAHYITGEIINIIEQNATANADLLILIDKTGSMRDDIDSVIKGLNQIINSVKKFQKVRFAIALYGDKNSDGNDWFSFQNFEYNYQGAQSFITKIEVTNGDDYPESVYDALMKCMNNKFWQSNAKRMMLLIGDAPSLEKPLSDYTLTDVVNRSKQDRIALNLYPIVISSINNSDEVGTPSAEIPSSPQPKAVNLLHSVFPNPANNVVSVRFLTPDNTNMIEILDMNGKKVKEKPCEDISWDFYVGDLPAGNYIVRAYNAKLEYQTEKLIIQH